MRQIEVTAQRLQGLRIDRRHIHGVADFALRQVIDDELHRLNGDLLLGLFGARA